MELPLSITTSGFKRIASLPTQKDFKFIFKDCSYECSRFQAVFLSPLVHERILPDPLVNEFTIDMDDPKGIFKDILNLVDGNPLRVTTSTQPFLISVSNALGNDELSNIIFEYLSGNELSIATVIPYIVVHWNNGDITEAVSFAAKNFDKLCDDQDILISLPPEPFIQILRHPDLSINAGQVFLLVNDIILKHGNEYTYLLNAINLEKLPTNYLSLYFKLLTDGEITAETLVHVSNYIVSLATSRPTIVQTVAPASIPASTPASIPTSTSNDQHSPEIPPSGPDGFPFVVNYVSDPLNGIFKKLFDTKGKPNEGGYIEIKASSYNEQRYRILDQDKETRWQSSDSPNSWVSFRIKDHTIKATHYTVRTYKVSEGSSGWHMKSWVLEGSSDETNWKTLDSRSGDMLNGAYIWDTLT